MDIHITVTHALSPILEAVLAEYLTHGRLRVPTAVAVPDGPRVAPERVPDPAAVQEPAAEQPAAPGKRGPGRPKKVVATPLPATVPSAPVAPEAPAVAPLAIVPLAPGEPTLADVSAVVKECLDKAGTNSVRDVFKQFKLSRLVDLKPAQFGEFLTALRSAKGMVATEAAK